MDEKQKQTFQKIIKELSLQELRELLYTIKSEIEERSQEPSLKSEADTLLRELFASQKMYLISPRISGLVALRGYRDNREKWYEIKSEWPEVRNHGKAEN